METRSIKQKNLTEISIAIDSLDDIFSDFDPRPLKDKVLSEDFITELKYRYREIPNKNYLVTIYAPVSLKDFKASRIVIQRLKTIFSLNYKSTKALRIQKRIRGLLYILMGMLFLGTLTTLTFHNLVSNYTLELLGIVLMPLGWFGIWEGFSKVIENTPITDEKLFEKLSKATYKFQYVDYNKINTVD